MSRVKTAVGAMVLCALAFGLLGASNAFAVGKGLTAVTCTNAPGGAGTGKFATNHCETPEVAGSNFETVEITPAGTPTAVTGEAVGKSVLSGKLLTLEVEVTCNKMSSTGEVTNELVNEEHKAHGTNTVLTYSECTAHLKGQATEACEVENKTGNTNHGEIKTVSLTLTTGIEHKVTIKPTTGTEFTKFKVLNTGTNCHLPATETTVNGETTALANTTKHSHLTLVPSEGTGKGLTAFLNPATYEGTNTGYMSGTENTVGLTTFTPTE